MCAGKTKSEYTQSHVLTLEVPIADSALEGCLMHVGVGRFGRVGVQPAMVVLACFSSAARCGHNELQDVVRRPGGL